MVESALEFSLCVLWKMILFMRDFQNMVSSTESMDHCKCKYFLLIFYHNNGMLKTDIMLDYW